MPCCLAFIREDSIRNAAIVSKIGAGKTAPCDPNCAP